MTTLPSDDPRMRAWRLYQRASALVDMGRFPEAASAAQEALAVEPGSARTLCILAQSQLQIGLTDAALANVQQACALDPTLEWGYRLRTLCHRRRQEYALAIAAAQEAVRLAPENDLVLGVLADALQAGGDLDEAMRLALYICEIAPQSVWAYERCGNITLERQQYAEAEMYFRHVLALNPLRNGCLANLGWALLYQGRPGEAIPFFMNRIRHQPNRLNTASAEKALHTAVLIHLGEYQGNRFPVETVSPEERCRRWAALPEDLRRWHEARACP